MEDVSGGASSNLRQGIYGGVADEWPPGVTFEAVLVVATAARDCEAVPTTAPHLFRDCSSPRSAFSVNSQATAAARQTAAEKVHPLFHRQGEPAGDEILEMTVALGGEAGKRCTTVVGRDGPAQCAASPLLRELPFRGPLPAGHQSLLMAGHFVTACESRGASAPVRGSQPGRGHGRQLSYS